MKQLLPALLLALLSTACATAPDEADDVVSAASGPELVTCDVASALVAELEQVYLEDELRLDLPTRGEAGLLPVNAPSRFDLDTSAVCECADDLCVIDWIGDSLGCGVCAHVACSDGARGGCVSCETEDDLGAPTACVLAEAEVSALE